LGRAKIVLNPGDLSKGEDGDLVEVDADAGVVRVVLRAGEVE